MDQNNVQKSQKEALPPGRNDIPNSKSAGHQQPNIHQPQQARVLVPQGSNTIALRRTSDSISSDVRALDYLDHLGNSRTLKRSPTHQRTDIDADTVRNLVLLEKDTDIETDDDKSLHEEDNLPNGENKRSSDEERLSFHSLPTSRSSEPKDRYSTGKFLFLDEKVNMQDIDSLEEVESLPQLPPALGTSAITNPATSISHSFRLSIPDLSPQISPTASTASSTSADLTNPLAREFIPSKPGEAVDSLPADLSQISNTVSQVDDLAVKNARPRFRRRAIDRARNVILKKKILVLLFGHHGADVVQSALQTIKNPVQVPNLDGSMSMAPPMPAAMFMSCMTSQESLAETLPPISRRETIIRRRALARMKAQNANIDKLAQSCLEPQRPQTLAEEAYLMRRRRKGSQSTDYPKDTLRAKVQEWEKKRSWRYRLRLRRPGSKFFETMLPRRSSQPKNP